MIASSCEDELPPQAPSISPRLRILISFTFRFILFLFNPGTKVICSRQIYRDFFTETGKVEDEAGKSFIKQQLPFICYYSHKQLKSEKYMTTLGGWMNKTLIGWGVDPKFANTFDETIIAILIIAVAVGLDYLFQAISTCSMVSQ